MPRQCQQRKEPENRDQEIREAQEAGRNSGEVTRKRIRMRGKDDERMPKEMRARMSTDILLTKINSDIIGMGVRQRGMASYREL